MDKIKRYSTLNEIVIDGFKTFENRIAFLEKNKENREYEQITYQKLRDDIISLGTFLIENLKVENKKIGIIGENSYRWYVSYMATVCSGAIVVPLDKELPENEIENLCKRANVEILIYSDRKSETVLSVKERLPKKVKYINMNNINNEDEIYSLDSIIKEGKELVDTGNVNFFEKKISENEFKILIFTSGTTASSKGVMLSHKNITTNLYSSCNVIPALGKLRFFSILPMHHTYAFMADYLIPTSMGGSVAICEGLKYINKNLVETKPNVLVAVPLLAENIVKKIEKKIKELGKEKTIKTVSSVANALNKIGIDFRGLIFKKIHESLGGNLKYIFCGAASVDITTLKKLESFGFTVLQGYGLTEASPLITATHLDDKTRGGVGKPIKDVEVRIDLEENSNAGEIIAKGDNIMLGYYENEEETNKVLKKGWLYTGDIGYFNNEGNLIISGRSKNVIVTKNGKKIFPEELEFLINKIPLVNESMVYGEESKEDNTYVTLAVKVTLDEEYIEEEYTNNRPSDEEIHEIIWEEIKKINRKQVPYKTIKKLEIKKEDFERTTTMKIQRFKEINKDK